MKKNTYSRAYEACEQFFSETGIMPTIETIKPIIGINSPATISSAIKDWKAALSTAVKREQSQILGVPVCVTDVAMSLWQLALEEALKAQEQQRHELDVWAQDLSERESELNAKEMRIAEQIELLKEKHQEEVAFLHKDLARLTAETEQAHQLAQQHQQQRLCSDKANAVLEEEIRQEKAKLALIEARYNQEHEWSLRRIEEEKEALRKLWQSDMAKLKNEVERLKSALDVGVAKLDAAQMIQTALNEKVDLLNQRLTTELDIKAQLNSELETVKTQLKKKDQKLTVLLEKLGKSKRQLRPKTPSQ